jgi:haloacetate dehalogenase
VWPSSRGLSSPGPVLDLWRQYADEAGGEQIPQCGYFIAEECPEPLLRHLSDFLDEP